MIAALLALALVSTPTTAPSSSSSTVTPARSSVVTVRRAIDRARLREVCTEAFPPPATVEGSSASSPLVLCAVLGAGLAAATGTCGRLHDLDDGVRTGCDVSSIIAAALAGACGAVELATAAPKPHPP